MDGPKLRRRIGRPALIAMGVAILLVSSVIQAAATHGLATLAGSNFEIDDDANLKNDDGGSFVDWADLDHPTGPEIRGTDAATGQNDNSYKGGVKEDTSCPAETTGSIPNNKSDLLTFSLYEEPGTGGHPGFLNLAWSRVTDPSGTTLMDFEFNQSSTGCLVGPNVVRTAGDLLIEYAIDQGGSRADISGRFWTGTAWGPTQDLDAPSATCPDGLGDPAPCATGTMNSTPIPAAESDGLIASGSKAARTFGEAQLDLRLIFNEDECASFGSAMLKSRSSDAFTSQLKDFISPVPISLNNCAQVIIRKETIPDGAAGTFDFTKTFPTDPATEDTFSLEDDGVQDYGATVLFGTGLEAAEDLTTLPDGFALDDIDCDVVEHPSVDVTPTIDVAGGTVTFNLDSDTDVLDCTFFNEKQTGAIQITKTRKHAADGAGDHPHAGVAFVITGGDRPAGGTTVTTGADGTVCLDGLGLSSLVGDYTVTETVPAGYVSADSEKTVSVTQTSTCGDGDEATVSFQNTPLTDLTVTVNSQVNGGTKTTIDCVDDTAPTPVKVIDVDVAAGPSPANGDGSGTALNLEPGIYTCTIDIDP